MLGASESWGREVRDEDEVVAWGLGAILGYSSGDWTAGRRFEGLLFEVIQSQLEWCMRIEVRDTSGAFSAMLASQVGIFCTETGEVTLRLSEYQNILRTSSSNQHA